MLREKCSVKNDFFHLSNDSRMLNCPHPSLALRKKSTFGEEIQKPVMTSPFSHWNAFGCKWCRYGSVLHPDFAIPLAKAISAGEVELGVAICGNSVGASSAANKVPGVNDRIGHRRVSSGACS